MPIKYLDISSYNTAGYAVANEYVPILREMASIAGAQRIAAITGGGESVLLGFLPGGGEVCGADVSRESIGWAFMKALLIETFSTADIREIMSSRQSYEKACKHLNVPWRLRRYTCLAGGDFENLRNAWMSAPDSDIDEARENLGNLTLVHGSLSELQGKFGLVYVSNARSYPSRYPPLPLKDLMSMIEDDGYLLEASGGRALNWEVAAEQRNKMKLAEDIKMDWTYTLYRRPIGTEPPSVFPASVRLS